MNKLDAWIRRVTDNEMPIFGRTVQEVISVSENDDASASQLGQAVLKDAAMTSRVLKLANSSYYNPTRQRFSTISRAIMMLGFDTVRSMCLTVALIESLVQGVHRDNVTRAMARSLHAASQAQLLAEARRDSNPEEVFISTLLFHIGDLSFWCFAGDEGEALDQAMQQPGVTAEQAQKRTLGFTLQELSRGLAREWRLSELLQDTLEHPERSSDRGKAITLSHQLAAAVEQGWDSDQVKGIIGRMAALSGVTPAKLEDELHETAKRVVETSAYYGAKAIAGVIPLPSRMAVDQAEGSEPEAPAFPEPDPGLQLQILRELSGLLDGQADFNMVLEMILEGIHRGVGMDRVLFAMLSADRKELKPKFVLGDPEDKLRNAFRMSLDSDAAAPVRHALAQDTLLTVDAEDSAGHKQHVSDAFCWITGSDTLLLAPIVLNGRPVGVIYADRAPSKRAVDRECSESFRHFAQQASLLLNHLASRR